LLEPSSADVEHGQAKVVFSHENWHVPQVITVSAIDDNVGEGIHNATLRHFVGSIDEDYISSSDEESFAFTPGVNATASVTDNDEAAIMLTLGDAHVHEGGEGASTNSVSRLDPCRPSLSR